MERRGWRRGAVYLSVLAVASGAAAALATPVRAAAVGAAVARATPARATARYAQARPATLATQRVEAPARVSGRSAGDGPPALPAARLTGEIEVDGRMDEEAWSTAPVATDFAQFQPEQGAPATEPTEARVLYGDDALFVFIRALDSRPDGIAAQLTRRDQDSYSDLVGVVVDSYFDRRTAFQFAVNPVGVKRDVYHFDDTEEDRGWDAVWNVATTRDARGWSAEFRIPYSQLRFRDGAELTWGINFVREIARRDETSLWAPTAPTDGAIVSRFGELRGLRGLGAPGRLEVAPYSVARLERAPGDEADPLYQRNQVFGSVGADVKYGLTGALTLDVTINPDFGQVEADPSQVNLSAFETFFQERRPFFLEGASIFRFGIGLGDGDGAGESLFYSRRIGRPPQGSADARGGFVDAEDRTTILGAWKLSGKTAGGWSLGALHAVTTEERARVVTGAGERLDSPAEPLTHYGVLRVQKDFREGRTAVGAIGTGALRDASVAEGLSLRSDAYAGGLDFRHRFLSDAYEVSGYALGSFLRGSPEAIEATQRSSLRYFQRPDAGHVTLDPERASLDGASTFVSVGKVAGEHWRFSTGLHARTPGFEVNDLGFQTDADFLTNWIWVGYRQSAPQGPFRRWNLNLNGWTSRSWGGELRSLGGNVNGNAQLASFWTIYAGIGRDLEAFSPSLLRGGPLLRREASTNVWGGFGSDDRKVASFDLNGWGGRREASGSWNAGVSPSVRIRPSGRASFTASGSLSRNADDRQWVTRLDGADATGEDAYVFGRLDQTTVRLTLRADYTFTPDLSLQLYAQPFVSAGAYTDFKRVADPLAGTYRERFQPLDARLEADRVFADLGAGGASSSFARPDFNVRQFRSNAVLRWQYRPGSTLFLVWSQARDDAGPDGAFRFGPDLGGLFGAPAHDTFALKVSYWVGG